MSGTALKLLSFFFLTAGVTSWGNPQVPQILTFISMVVGIVLSLVTIRQVWYAGSKTKAEAEKLED